MFICYLTIPFLACLFLSFNSFIKVPTSYIRSILLRSLDVPGGFGQSYTATQSNLGLGMFIFSHFTYFPYVSKFRFFYINILQVYLVQVLCHIHLLCLKFAYLNYTQFSPRYNRTYNEIQSMFRMNLVFTKASKKGKNREGA